MTNGESDVQRDVNRMTVLNFEIPFVLMGVM